MALVTYVLGNCPSCKGENSFGNIDVRGSYVSLGCKSCDYRDRIELPQIRKKILYLDQFFLSSAFRANDRRFLEIANLIADLCAKQLLVVPYSSVHEQETYQWEHYNELLHFIKSTARGHEFLPEYEVEACQIERSFDSWMNNEPSKFKRCEEDVFHDDIHRWDGYYWIDVGGYSGDREQVRQLKTETVGQLVQVFDEWRTSSTTFEEDLDSEFRDAAQVYWESYCEYLKRLADGEVDAFFDSPVNAQIVWRLVRRVPSEIPNAQRHRMVVEYLRSDHFREIPRMDIGCRLFAGLRAMVKAGAYSNREKARKRLSGIFQDVTHVETYAPYCDAFIADQAMSDLMTKPGVEIGKRYDVEIFSLNNWDALFNWLNQLEVDMTKEHRDALSKAYPLQSI